MASTYETTTGREDRLHGSIQIKYDFDNRTLEDHKLGIHQMCRQLEEAMITDLEKAHKRVMGHVSR